MHIMETWCYILKSVGWVEQNFLHVPRASYNSYRVSSGQRWFTSTIKRFSVVARSCFPHDLTAELNDLSTQLQGKNRAIIKMIGAIDSFKGKLKLWKTQLMKGVLTHFPSIWSRADGTFDVSVYILCIDILLKAFERRFKDFEHIKFTVSFITNPFQERDVRVLNLFLLCSRKIWVN